MDDIGTKNAQMTKIFSICCEALQKARVQKGDYLLLNADNNLGLFMLVAAKKMELSCIYSDKDKERSILAGQIADLVLSPEASAEELLAATAGEGPNIIVDLTDEPERLAAMVQQISQAGRIVIVGNKKGEDHYHMRTLSIKEGEIIGFHTEAGECFENISELSECVRDLAFLETSYF